MNVPVLNVWDETQQKYVGIPAVAYIPETLKDEMRGEMLKMLSDLGLAKFASSDGSVLYTSHDGKIYVL